jgi:hypothetical protein
MLSSAFLQHATPIPSHDTTRGMIQLVSRFRMIQEGYSPSTSDNNKSCPLPIELKASTGLSGTFPTGFSLHKGAPSLLYSPLATSPYQCRFLSSKYQAASFYCYNLDPGLLYFKVIISLLDKPPIFLKDNSPISSILQILCR